MGTKRKIERYLCHLFFLLIVTLDFTVAYICAILFSAFYAFLKESTYGDENDWTDGYLFA